MSGKPDQGDDANQQDANQDSQPFREPALGEQVAVPTVSSRASQRIQLMDHGRKTPGHCGLLFLWKKVSKEYLIFTDVIAFK